MLFQLCCHLDKFLDELGKVRLGKWFRRSDSNGGEYVYTIFHVGLLEDGACHPVADIERKIHIPLQVGYL